MREMGSRMHECVRMHVCMYVCIYVNNKCSTGIIYTIQNDKY